MVNEAASTERMAAAFAWVESVIGGTIVARAEQARWRPHWFLDVRRPAGEIVRVLLRGYRRGVVTDATEAATRKRLRREAGVLAALQGTGVKVPQYYGYEPELQWLLMECVEGEERITAVADPARQAAIFADYLDNVALLHSLDWTALQLPDTLFRPRDAEDAATWNFRFNDANYRAQPRDADPLYCIARHWLAENRPVPIARWSLCTGDIGPNQFFFEGNRLKAMFDLEMAYIGDPMQDIGLMRYRNMCYPIQGFAQALEDYLHRMGRRDDRASLAYWTVVAMLGASLTYMTKLHRLDPRSPAEMTMLLAVTPIRRRGLAEILHRIFGFALPGVPPAPPTFAGHYDRYFDFVAAEVEEHHLARDPGNYDLRLLHGHIGLLGLCHRDGPVITADNARDLGSLPGIEAPTESEGLAALEAAIDRDWTEALEVRLNALYRIECRNERLMRPVMEAAGFATGIPLDRL
jgi:aminoglycoside phosphotransferase (APT) family kinase protein